MLPNSLPDTVLRAADRDLLEDVMGRCLPSEEGQGSRSTEEGLHLAELHAEVVDNSMSLADKDEQRLIS